MTTQLVVAFFSVTEDARDAIEDLRRRGYVTSLDQVEDDLPDPDLSVSALMVGFLPDLSHGIFGSDNYKEKKKKGAYLLVMVDQHQSKQEAEDIIAKYGGEAVHVK